MKHSLLRGTQKLLKLDTFVASKGPKTHKSSNSFSSGRLGTVRELPELAKLAFCSKLDVQLGTKYNQKQPIMPPRSMSVEVQYMVLRTCWWQCELESKNATAETQNHWNSWEGRSNPTCLKNNAQKATEMFLNDLGRIFGARQGHKCINFTLFDNKI